MRLDRQAENFLTSVSTRRRNPVRGVTVQKYRGILTNWILPLLGQRDLRDIENGAARELVQHLTDAKLSATTINSVFNVLKDVVKSAVDSNGNELYPRVWNTDFIDLPVIKTDALVAPTVTSADVQTALAAPNPQDKALYALLAGTGLRIGEAAALTLGTSQGNVWLPDLCVIKVNSTVVDGKIQTTPKTEAGNREVDLHPDLNQYLVKLVGNHDGLVFQNRDGGILNEKTARKHLKLAGLKADGQAFHAFRRFRITHLEAEGVPAGLQRFWTGHASKDVHERYIKFQSQTQTRREWARRAGLGFNLEAV